MSNKILSIRFVPQAFNEEVSINLRRESNWNNKYDQDQCREIFINT